MSDIDIGLDLDITCDRCGESLIYSSEIDVYKDITVTVEPCDKCLGEKESEGFDEGKAEGHKEGLEEAAAAEEAQAQD